MLTYFVHVHGPSYDRDGPEVWRGGKPRELYDLDDLKRAVRPHADLPIDLATKLYGDRDEER